MAQKSNMLKQGQKAGEKIMMIFVAICAVPIVLTMMWDKYPGFALLFGAIIIVGGIIAFRAWRADRREDIRRRNAAGIP